MSATALDYYPSQFASRSLPATATAPRPSLPLSRGATLNYPECNVAGPDTRLTAHVLAKQCGHQPAVQAFADVPPSHFLEPFRVPVLVGHDANENGFTDAETPFAPGAKDHD